MFARGVAAAISLGVVALAMGCGSSGSSSNSGGPTGPTSSNPVIDPQCAPSRSPLNCAPVNSIGIVISDQAYNLPALDGPFSFTVAGLTIAGSGQQYTQIIGLSAGDYEVSGQLLTAGMNFLLIATPSNVPGGVVRGSVQNVEGPLSSSPLSFPGCQIQYFNSTGTPVNFRFRFTITGAVQGQSERCV
jgi:hypothetical protein